MRNNNKVQQKNNVTIKAEAISEDSFSKNSSSDIFADLVENSSLIGSSHNNNNGLIVERGEHIIILSLSIKKFSCIDFKHKKRSESF